RKEQHEHPGTALRREREQEEQLTVEAPPDPETGIRKLAAARRDQRRADRRRQELRTELTGHREQLERMRLTAARRETLLEAAAEELDRFPPGLETVDGPERTLRGRLQHKERELEQLGPVNHRAQAEREQEGNRSHRLAAEL